MPIHWISALFEKFQIRYGNKWVSTINGIEEAAIKEWSQQLDGITGDQLITGLENWNSNWPPTLIEFKNACLGIDNGLNDYGLNYVPEYYRDQPVVDHAKRLSSDERENNRKKNLKRIKKMRKRLGI